MVCIEHSDVSEKEFVALLKATRESALSCFQDLEQFKEISGEEFEKTVCDLMTEQAVGTNFEGHVKQTPAKAFPDILAKKYFGVEVKKTMGDKWVSTGNSVLETTRDEYVKRIYVFFGKFGGSFDVKYRPYQECLSDIGVTHSPRYMINMDLLEGESILDKMGVGYDQFRENNKPIDFIKKYFRSKLRPGEELWWVDRSEADIVSPTIRQYEHLTKEEKANFQIHALAYFPELFSSNNKIKYKAVAAYLVASHGAVNPSMRDAFSAGGQVGVEINGIEIKIPKMLHLMRQHAKGISNILTKTPRANLARYWKVESVANSIATWKRLLNENSSWSRNGLTAADIFDSGLL